MFLRRRRGIKGKERGKKMPSKKKARKNENCLAGMACPECGSLGPFRIVVSCMMDVRDDGTDPSGCGDVEWNDDSYCRCGECNFDGEVHLFKTTTKTRSYARVSAKEGPGKSDRKDEKKRKRTADGSEKGDRNGGEK